MLCEINEDIWWIWPIILSWSDIKHCMRFKASTFYNHLFVQLILNYLGILKVRHLLCSPFLIVIVSIEFFDTLFIFVARHFVLNNETCLQKKYAFLFSVLVVFQDIATILFNNWSNCFLLLLLGYIISKRLFKNLQTIIWNRPKTTLLNN